MKVQSIITISILFSFFPILILSFSHFHVGNGKTTFLTFKKTENSENENISFFEGLKRFLPWISRAKLEKSYAQPLPSTGMRYHFRLIKPDEMLRRHVITRIIRYFPDITWETAGDIVSKAMEDGVSIIRIMNSQVRFVNNCYFNFDIFISNSIYMSNIIERVQVFL